MSSGHVLYNLFTYSIKVDVHFLIFGKRYLLLVCICDKIPIHINTIIVWPTHPFLSTTLN